MPALDIEAELNVLTLPAQDSPIPKQPQLSKKTKKRDSELEPLILAAAFASGPHVTRNHYSHDFFPAVADPRAEGAWDWTKWTGENASSTKNDPKRRSYNSQQAPRRHRLRALGLPVDPEPQVKIVTSPTELKSPSLRTHTSPPGSGISDTNERLGFPPSDTVQVRCMARTRIPTPHGPVFLHLYHNNKDNKEHLAIVVDPAQFQESSQLSNIPPIRSRSLDAEWSPNETPMERITRGAYVGKLSPNQHVASVPPSVSAQSLQDVPPALVRIHSECFTGETIGSMRCDCGEQLDEAIRQISQPTVQLPSDSNASRPNVIPGRGVVVYLRQEGRGIGLLSKIRAYNLQDLGHDTVAANILLGHGADERKYDIAGAILRDLGFGEGVNGEAVKLLTNNPDKVEALEKEGLKVVERVPMVPKSWAVHQQQHDLVTIVQPATEGGVITGPAALHGFSSHLVHGPDLDKYLRTKVLRMGHMLPLLGHDAT